MPAVALYRGPAHVIVAMNDEYRAMVPGAQPGMPTGEAWAPPDGEARALVNEVYRTGSPRVALLCIRGAWGRFTVLPLPDGVGTCWTRLAAPRSPRRPRAG